jgi:hypothetical protein
MVQGIDYTSVSPFCRLLRLWGSFEWCTFLEFAWNSLLYVDAYGWMDVENQHLAI